jgi:hypothetical protein
MPGTGSDGKGGSRRRPADHRLADTKLDGMLDEWPPERPGRRSRRLGSPSSSHQARFTSSPGS